MAWLSCCAAVCLSLCTKTPSLHIRSGHGPLHRHPSGEEGESKARFLVWRVKVLTERMDPTAKTGNSQRWCSGRRRRHVTMPGATVGQSLTCQQVSCPTLKPWLALSRRRTNSVIAEVLVALRRPEEVRKCKVYSAQSTILRDRAFNLVQVRTRVPMTPLGWVRSSILKVGLLKL